MHSANIQRYLMCIYDARHHNDQPQPGDESCDSKNIGALTASVMAGLATLDGVFCKPDVLEIGKEGCVNTSAFLTTSYVQRWADSSGRRPLMIVLPILAMVASGSMVLACESLDTRVVKLRLISRHHPERHIVVVPSRSEWDLRFSIDQIRFRTLPQHRRRFDRGGYD